MRGSYSSGRLDIWPAFTDFVTSVSLLLVLLLASAPWFLTSELLTPRLEPSAGAQLEREPFNPAVELDKRQKELERQLGSLRGIQITGQGQEQRIIFQDEGGRGILFDSADARLKPEFQERLRPLRRVLVKFMDEGYVQRIEVEGHSDRVPYSGGGESNWSLSARRAVSVAEFLIRDPSGLTSGQIAPWLVTAKGYGEYKPAGFQGTPTPERARDGYGEHYKYIVDRSRTPGELARNRRIEVLLFYRWPREASRTSPEEGSR